VRPLRIALAAGEQSGDTLGAGLITALRTSVPDARFVGIAGPKMVAAGCEPWFRAEELSVMGLAEVLPHLPRLLRIRSELRERIKALPADIFVGIDAPDFNLPVSAWLKRTGIPTVQYVSPQIWAWRQGRVKTIRHSVDLVLCVLPFEAQFYEQHGVEAKFIGHPLADEIPLEADRAAARVELGLPASKPLLAVLPGSRRAEVATLARPFMASAAWVQRERPDLEVAVALASDAIGTVFRDSTGDIELARPPHLITARAHEVLAAADVVLTASGTASLETLLFKRPMVVAHRIVPLTYWIVRRLGANRLAHLSLPNLLAGREIVPEFLQGRVRPDVLGPALRDCFNGILPAAGWYDAFTAIHRQLRCDASSAAAREVLDLVRKTA
jgi:lipid-A-disaccharide synthase